MNEHEIAKKITGYLDRGTAELKAGSAYRLQGARQQALLRLAQLEHGSDLALTGGSTLGERRLVGGMRIGIGVVLLVAGILSYQYWQAEQQAHDIEETDAAILASELPIEAYLDEGFQAWLKHSEP
jgi:hypothetical protein